MKPMLTALAALTMASSMAGAVQAKDHGNHGRGHDNGRHNGWNKGGHGGDRWDAQRHNGYYYQERWYYGPPPVAYYGRPDFRLGYTPWSRGGYLPPVYRRTYIVYDYPRYHLRRPPPGYVWHRVGSDYVLAALATGLILEVMAHH
jgi:Ni/Co efflux regulator RcnB